MKYGVFAAAIVVAGCGGSASKSDMGGDGGMAMQACMPDGKTVTVNVKGTSAQGQPVDAVVVYDKQ